MASFEDVHTPGPDRQRRPNMGTTHRERVLTALNHEETDRVPIDFGGSHDTAVNVHAYIALLKHLGFESEIRDEWERGAVETVIPSERVLRHFDIDVRGEEANIRDVDSATMLDENSFVNGWGVISRRAHAGAPFMIVEGPLQRLDDPTPADVESLPWPDSDNVVDLTGLRDRIERLRNQTDCALVVKLRNVGAFNLAQRLRGFTEFLEDLVINPAFAEALHDRLTDLICRFAATVLDEVGDLVDGASFADDLGIQTQTLLGPELYRSSVKPHHARLVETVHAHTDAKMIMHSCGSIRALLGDLIDCGIQVINPVQVNAEGMDSKELKREFGKDLCFWGGVDTQNVLPYGSPADVAQEVRRRIADLGPGGGYVLTAVHNIQSEVPPENIVAMYETAAATAV